MINEGTSCQGGRSGIARRAETERRRGPTPQADAEKLTAKRKLERVLPNGRALSPWHGRNERGRDPDEATSRVVAMAVKRPGRRRFADRHAAGRVLARMLEHLQGPDTVVLALPRGGLPVAYEVADHLGSPLDVIVVRKLGLPWQPEFALGAIGEGEVRVVDEDAITRAGIRHGELEEVERRERTELERRVLSYRGDRPPVPLAGRVALIVDDGIATGSTARAAAAVARASGARSVVVAAPVGPKDSAARLGSDVEEVILAATPEPFRAIGPFYEDFSQTTDEEVRRLLAGTGS